MRVLILGTDTPLGQALMKHLVGLGRHDLVPKSRSACRWKSERQAKKVVRRASGDIDDYMVELNCDRSLDYRCTIDALTAVRGYHDRSGRERTLIQKVRLISPGGSNG